MQLKAPGRAFTLIELLVVIAVAGILAALAVPAIKEFGRGNQQVAATRQLLDDVGRARQLAMANRTTVYMVFLPNGYLTGNLPYPGNLGGLPLQSDSDRALQLAGGQMRSYALMSLRSIADQPGQNRAQYLTEWKTLPPGWLIAPAKFVLPTVTVTFTNANSFGPPVWNVNGFAVTNGLPFPSADAPLGQFYLPYIAFNHLGQLASGYDEYIPLARGTVDPALGADGKLVADDATVTESPLGNSFSDYNIIHIDWLTGRAKLETRQIE
jgi:prepilin-type N-terminal cleavage/methylation domain-containing protein